VERCWRTRPDPFAGHWAEVEAKLKEAPTLEGKAFFTWLCERYPGVYDEGQLRSFQRRLRQWRAQSGPEKEVYFAQEHRPGVRLSTDFTWMGRLGITLRGEPFAHLLCHSVLAYSNWEWATICGSESFLSLQAGVQAALLRLGHVPAEHWTDHSTAATHEVEGDAEGRRDFNRRYRDLMEHLGMTPRTIQPGRPNENGDVESLNGALKRCLEQHLLLRGRRDFEDQEAYRRFLEEVMTRANARRLERLREELAAMRPFTATLLPAYVEERARVSRYSTFQHDRKMYSVPSRLIGEEVTVRRYEEHLEVYYAGTLQERMPRLKGEKDHAINYRHIIEWLVRKPGAFRGYRFRQELFPGAAFRRAYDRLCEACPERTADLEYLRILRQAARTMQSQTEEVLLELERRDLTPRWNLVLEFWPTPKTELPDLAPYAADLHSYDSLFVGPGSTP
jgi:transposase InsO family protein